MMNTLLDKNKAQEVLYVSVLMLIIGISFFLVSIKQAYISNYDLAVHINFGNEMWDGTRTIAYPGWYVVYKAITSFPGVSDQVAASLTNALFAMLCGLTVFGLCDYLGEVSLNKKCAIVLFMHFFGPLYFPQFGKFSDRYYLGQGSFNTWHSPTNSCVKFAALFVFVAFTQYFHMKEKEQWALSEKILLSKKQLGTVLCVATFVSLLLKPSFFQVFAPMLAVVFVMDFICERRNLKEYCMDAVIFVPSVVFVVYQMIESLLSPTAVALGGGGIEIAFLEVWRTFSDHILLSIVAIVLFPALVGIFCEQKLGDNKLLLYAYVFYTVATMEAAILAETGPRKFHGNFTWGMDLSIGILFFAALLTFNGICEKIQINNQRCIKAESI